MNELDEIIKRCIKNTTRPLIRSVTVNETKRIITVVFNDGDVRMEHCSKEDHFDPKIGIALCVVHHMAGSKNKYNKMVERMIK